MRSRAIAIGLSLWMGMGLGLGLAPARLVAQQKVFLDFSAFQTRLNEATAAAGVANFSGAETTSIRNNIQSYLQSSFGGYTVNFSQSNPGGTFSTLNFNLTASGLYGLADGIDLRNQVLNDVARIYTANFSTFLLSGDTRALQIQKISNALGGTAAHELGHNMGLEHRDAYGLIGMPPCNSTGGGLSGGIQNQTLMATGITGLTDAQRVLVRQFSDLDHAKLNFGNQVVSAPLPLTNDNGANHTIGTAQAVNFSNLVNPGGDYDRAALVRGVLGGSGSSAIDIYRINLTAGQFVTVETVSEPVFGTTFFDTVLDLVDSNGSTLLVSTDDTTLDLNGINPGGNLYSRDSTIVNFQATHDGTFYLRVKEFGLGGGDYYLMFASGMIAVPEPSWVSGLMILGLGWSSRLRRRSTIMYRQ